MTQGRGDAPPRGHGLAAPGVVLGVGLGGFVDGIVLHQVLQWHHMLSTTDSDRLGLPYHSPDTVEGLQVNTLWDGLFHVASWLAVVIGLALLVSRARRRPPGWVVPLRLVGWILVGWGVFNLVEGIVNHHLLGIHHVRPGPDQAIWDAAFLALGAGLVIGGWALQRFGAGAARGQGSDVPSHRDARP